ncbi:MAG: hypothetical protein IPL98_18370 [Saprospiraceae bacterium]|nr:hypothetical protein [Saprospiraceae bacterium]
MKTNLQFYNFNINLKNGHQTPLNFYKFSRFYHLGIYQKKWPFKQYLNHHGTLLKLLSTNFPSCKGFLPQKNFDALHLGSVHCMKDQSNKGRPYYQKMETD